MTKSSRRWLERQQRDPFVKKAKQQEQRSRAVYKLEEIDKKDSLFKPGQIVTDLGAAPGSWSEYAIRSVGHRGKVLAVDLLEMDPIDKLLFIKGDFTEAAIVEQCLDVLADSKVDLVISDMAPNLTGIRITDQARSMHIAECVLDFSRQVLRRGGSMLVKMFQGEGSDAFKNQLRQEFQRVVIRKPKASRDDSREFYLLGKDYM
jgi:23S rRNA (uridine2552-2'-O)-methyltransferase